MRGIFLAVICGLMRASAPTGSKLSACIGENACGQIWNPPLPIRQSVSYLWYFIPALIVQAR